MYEPETSKCSNLGKSKPYFGINKLRQLTDEDGCEYVLWIGSKRLIKRKKLEEFLEHAESL